MPKISKSPRATSSIRRLRTSSPSGTKKLKSFRSYCNCVERAFSDEVHLQAAKNAAKEKEQIALHNLALTGEITRTFLDETLKDDKRATLQSSEQMTVHHFARANEVE